MTLEKLQSELIQAKKNKDQTRNLVLTNLVGAVKKAAIDKNCRDNITEDMVNEVLLKQKKMVQEMIDTCPVDRVETLADYKKQMEIVNEFAPTLITDEAKIKEIVVDLSAQNNIELVKSNRGAIMKIVSANLKGKADMSIASKVVGGMLQ
jgi:uncharacterized protein YqeY